MEGIQCVVFKPVIVKLGSLNLHYDCDDNVQEFR